MWVTHVWLAETGPDDGPVVFAREDDARAYVDAVASGDENWAASRAPLQYLVCAGEDAADAIRGAGGSHEAVDAAMIAAPRSDGNSEALDAIAAVMSGQEWDAETMDSVAAIVRATGRLIADVDEDDDGGDEVV